MPIVQNTDPGDRFASTVPLILLDIFFGEKMEKKGKSRYRVNSYYSESSSCLDTD